MRKSILTHPETNSLRSEVLGELQALRERLEVIPSDSISQPFFCHLDNEKHPATDLSYQCGHCARHICGTCYQALQEVRMASCPYCGGPLLG